MEPGLDRCLKVACFRLYIVLSVSDLLLNLKQLNQNKYLSLLTSTVCLFWFAGNTFKLWRPVSMSLVPFTPVRNLTRRYAHQGKCWLVLLDFSLVIGKTKEHCFKETCCGELPCTWMFVTSCLHPYIHPFFVGMGNIGCYFISQGLARADVSLHLICHRFYAGCLSLWNPFIWACDSLSLGFYLLIGECILVYVGHINPCIFVISLNKWASHSLWECDA